MSKRKDSWIITAHPDDETIFFAGLILKFRTRNWNLVCVTDGNGDGRGQIRQGELKKSAKMLGIHSVKCLQYPDKFDQRLDIERLRQDLSRLGITGEIFTHGPLGEYGHPHHQDVSYAVHREFAEDQVVYSIAHNVFPELSIKLSLEDFQRKAKILSTVYLDETKRFYQMLPAEWSEGFIRVSQREVEAIYLHLTGQKTVTARELKIHRWLIPYLQEQFGRPIDRPF